MRRERIPFIFESSYEKDRLRGAREREREKITTNYDPNKFESIVQAAVQKKQEEIRQKSLFRLRCVAVTANRMQITQTIGNNMLLIEPCKFIRIQRERARRSSSPGLQLTGI